MKQVKVRDLMTQQVITLHKEQSITLADELMMRTQIHHLPVVNDDNKLVGIVSQRDLLASHISSMTKLNQEERTELQLAIPVERIMIRDVWSVRPQTPALDAAQLLYDNRFGCAPVIDDARRVIGIITSADFIGSVIDRLTSDDSDLIVRNLMTPDPVTLDENQSLSAAEDLMMLRHVRHVPIVNTDGGLTGLVSHRDLLTAQRSTLTSAPKFPANAKIGDIMSTDLWTVIPETPANKAAHQLRDHAFGCLPVIEAGRLIGLITEVDFLSLLLRGQDTLSPQAVRHDTPVYRYMQNPVQTVTPDDDISRAQHLIETNHISCVAVVDEHHAITGVVSRTDILRLSMPRLSARHRVGIRQLPCRQVREVMTADVISVALEDTISTAAGRMVEHGIHRVFVTEGARLLGVFSTTDAMTVTRDLRLTTPVAAFMTSVLFAINLTEAVGAGVKLLDRAHISGVVVLDHGWPVGVFTKREALASRHLPRDTPIEYAMSQAFACVPTRTPIYRVAGQAAALGVRRVVVFENGQTQGILTGMDFARACMSETPAHVVG